MINPNPFAWPYGAGHLFSTPGRGYSVAQLERTNMNQSTEGTRRRGFASMDPQRQREIASQGGREAHLQGKAHQFTSEEAREAGRKGGLANALRRQRAAGQTPAA
jgi:general stress protein YciG